MDPWSLLQKWCSRPVLLLCLIWGIFWWVSDNKKKGRSSIDWIGSVRTVQQWSSMNHDVFQTCLGVIPAEINTPSGRPSQILNTICGFQSLIPRITFEVLTRSDTFASPEKSPCQVGRVGDFFRIFLRLGLTFHGVTFDKVVRFNRNIDNFKGQ